MFQTHLSPLSFYKSCRGAYLFRRDSWADQVSSFLKVKLRTIFPEGMEGEEKKKSLVFLSGIVGFASQSVTATKLEKKPS